MKYWYRESTVHMYTLIVLIEETFSFIHSTLLVSYILFFTHMQLQGRFLGILNGSNWLKYKAKSVKKEFFIFPSPGIVSSGRRSSSSFSGSKRNSNLKWRTLSSPCEVKKQAIKKCILDKKAISAPAFHLIWSLTVGKWSLGWNCLITIKISLIYTKQNGK